MTLGGRHIEWHRRRPWDVPIGKVVTGIDVIHKIYSEYSDEPQASLLDPTKNATLAAIAWARFPKLDRFKGCRVLRDGEPDSDPGQHCKDEM